MEQIKKIRSRDAARQRRGQQNDEFGELAASLPLPATITEKLDRLCVMRLSTSYIKNKHVIQQIKGNDIGVHTFHTFYIFLKICVLGKQHIHCVETNQCFLV